MNKDRNNLHKADTEKHKNAESVRRLENELAMFKMLSSPSLDDNPVDEIFMSANNTVDNDISQLSPIEQARNRGEGMMKIDELDCDDESNLSALSHDMSVSSLTSRVWTVISHSSKILQGINPTVQDEDIDKISMIIEGSDGDESAGGQVQIRSSASFRSARSSDGLLNFLTDDKCQMTYGRIFALSLMNTSWYNPSLKLAQNENAKEPAPSLEKAWAYFEHIALPRHIHKPQDGKRPKELEYAKPGEDQRETRLYSPYHTSLEQMGDFGIGMGIYFASLKFLIIITFIAGLICIPNIIYYNSESYSKGQVGLKLMLSGSAVCTDVSLVPCPTCKLTQYPQSLIYESDSGLKFVRKNNCNAPPFMEGMLNLAVVVLMVVALWVMNKLQKRMTVRFDLDEQTAQDYSIQITNPPPDANDPKEWKRFFEDQFPGAHVTCCTICVNNDYLLNALVELRERYNQIKRKLPPGTKLDDKSLSLLAATCKNNRSGLSYILQFLHPFGLCLDVAALYNKVVVLTSEIKGLSQLNNPVTSLFITFETEMFQRQVLSSLSVSKSDALRNNKKIMKDKKQLFRREYVLQIVEPEEPSTIRWSYLNAPFLKSMKAVCITTVLTFIGIILSAWIIFITDYDKGYFYTALVIAVLNVVFPQISKWVTEIEPHKSETGYQTSLFVKIAIFRYVNTAIVINIITPFALTLGGGEVTYDADTNSILPMVYAIFFADLVTTNLSVFFQPFGHMQRHILGPRQINQDFMNMQFKGSTIMLAERYTNMTKIVFHGFYYCTLFPAAFFMSSAALLINYYVDKFSVMRTWAKTPKTGIAIGRINVLFILPISVLAMTLLSSYWWSGFPYDNLCENGVMENKYIGDHFIDTSNNVKPESYVVDTNTTSYQYCNQNLLRADGAQITFPAIPYWQNTDKWMTKDQELVTEIFGWASVCVLGILFLRFAWFTKKYIFSLFQATYEPQGKDKNINFSSVQGISCYIPQVISNEFSYPLIASCVDGVDTGLFEWKDPDKLHEFYNIMQDAKDIVFGTDNDKELPTNVFSRVYHYPPNPESSMVSFA